MEYETQQEGNWWHKLRESPRTVSALIIILVVAAAIYAFSGNNEGTQQAQEVTEAEPTEAAEQMQGEATSTALPEVAQTGEGYTEKAEAGDGLTHLARRAATRWLAEHNAGYAVTNEHRIYIEDYIQKKLGSGSLEIGQDAAISFGLIEEAVKAARELTPAQLNNLSQYTYALG